MAAITFLPWVRRGLAGAIHAPDSLGPDQPASAGITVDVAVNARPPVPVSLLLRGPSDVSGLDPRQVRGMQPPPGTTTFEPNHLAYIDLHRPELPWAYTPASPGQQGRLRPWLCLVVVQVQDGVELRPAGAGPGGLPVLHLGPPARLERELPDLTDAWAWAHGQVVAGTGQPATVRTALDDPSATLARLVCPRLLDPDTDYLACVVPSFDAGRRAGLGEEIREDELTGPHALAPAWSLTPDPPASLDLPVYVQWRFRTGAGGDFLSIAQRLQPQDGAALGSRPINLATPGFPLPATVPPDASVPLEGALRPMDSAEPPVWSGPVAQAFQAGVRPWLDAQETPPDGEPVLGPPQYGRRHVGRPLVPTPLPDPPGPLGWFDELNLDPRHRTVAALGTRVVQEHAEEFAAQAWAQAGELAAANQRLRQLHLSAVANANLHARRLVGLADETLLRVAAPLFPRLRSSGGTTLLAELARVPGPLAGTSGAMRRLARERGPVTRRLRAQGLDRSAVSWVAVMYSGPVAAPVVPVQGLATVRSVADRLTPPAAVAEFSAVTDDRIAGIGSLPTFHVLPPGQPVPPAFPAPGLPGHPGGHPADSPGAAAFRAAAVTHLAAVRPGRLGVVVDPVPPRPLDQVAADLRDQLHPAAHLQALAANLVAVGPGTTAPAAGTALRAAPTFPQPLYTLLRDLDPLLLLPGLDSIKPDRVVGLESNPRFVEAFLLGVNVELAAELLWREFPTDQRATFADRFWDSRTAGAPRPDITSVTSWADNRLGRNGIALPGSGRSFVLLMRSELLRRYPDASVYAVPAEATANGPVPDDEPDAQLFPAFRGDVPPEITFFGFDLDSDTAAGKNGGAGWFVVLQEHLAATTFGLDVGAPRLAHAFLSATAPPPVGLPDGGRPNAGLHWGRDAGQVGALLRRKPVRLAVHASRLLPGG
jgi:hypothetical protein